MRKQQYFLLFSTHVKLVPGGMLISAACLFADQSPSESVEPFLVVQDEHREEVLTIHVGRDVKPIMLTYKQKWVLHYHSKLSQLSFAL